MIFTFDSKESISQMRSICKYYLGGVNLYKKFEELLKKGGITPYKVHKDTGISQATLSDWKRGRSNPKLDKLQILADYFSVPITYFLDDTQKTV